MDFQVGANYRVTELSGWKTGFNPAGWGVDCSKACFFLSKPMAQTGGVQEVAEPALPLAYHGSAFTTGMTDATDSDRIS